MQILRWILSRNKDGQAALEAVPFEVKVAVVIVGNLIRELLQGLLDSEFLCV